MKTNISVIINGVFVCPSQKLSALENVLDMWLTSSQLEYIYKEWNAFFNNPYLYANTIVIDMVKLGLSNL